MGGRSAQIQSGDGRSVIRRARYGPKTTQLIQRHRSLEDIAAGEAECSLNIEGSQDLPADDGRFEVRRILGQQKLHVVTALGE